LNCVFIGNQYYLNGIDDGSNVPFSINGHSNGNMYFESTVGTYDISIFTLINDVSTEIVNEKLHIYWNWYFGKGALEVGHTYKVIFDGNEYEFAAIENSDASTIIIGDMTQYPFEVRYGSDDLILYSQEDMGIHTISLTDVTNDLQIISNEYVGSCNYSFISSPFILEEGQVYMVTWNGNTYTCAAKSNADSYNDIYIGNPVYGYLDGYQFSPTVQNTKDPFCIYYSAEDEDCIILYSYGAFNTCSIAKIEYTVHALDPKYLPIDVAFKSDFYGLKEQVNNINKQEYREMNELFGRV
jgi:hypothetical protein